MSSAEGGCAVGVIIASVIVSLLRQTHVNPAHGSLLTKANVFRFEAKPAAANASNRSKTGFWSNGQSASAGKER